MWVSMPSSSVASCSEREVSSRRRSSSSEIERRSCSSRSRAHSVSMLLISSPHVSGGQPQADLHLGGREARDLHPLVPPAAAGDDREGAALDAEGLGEQRSQLI